MSMKLKKWAILLPMVLLAACSSVNENEKKASDDIEIDFDALGIEAYTYPAEFTLGSNLNSAIAELALMYDTFDVTETQEENYRESFLFHFCQNSRRSYDYLEAIGEENNGMISKEQVQYIQYSLTNEFVDFRRIVPQEGLDINQASSGLGFGKILSYEADSVGDEVKLVAEFERGWDGTDNTKLYELDIVLLQNPQSCFDGYSIKSLTSKDITPIVTGDNKEYTFWGFDMEVENDGIFTFEYYDGEGDVQYGTHVTLDLSQNAALADFVRENAGKEFEVTYIFDESMTQPVYQVVPTGIELHE